MIRSKTTADGRRWGRALWATILFAACVTTGSALAWVDLDEVHGGIDLPPNGIFQTTGEYVMNVSELHIHITNWGLIGSYPSASTRFSDQPSAQWPAGTSLKPVCA